MNIPIHDRSSALATLTWLVPGDLAIKSAIILIAAWAAVLMMRRASAAARHFVWTLGVGATLTLPLLSGLLPKWRVLPAWIGPESASSVSVAVSETKPMPPAESVAPKAIDTRLPQAPAAPPITFGILNTPNTDSADAIPSHPVPPLMRIDPPVAPAKVPAAAAPRRTPSRWQAYIVVGWACGTALLMLPLAVSILGLWRMGRQLPRIEGGSWARLCRDMAAQLHLHRPVALLRGRPKAMPMTWGIFRPKLLLPPEADDWSPERRRIVLMHELAHIQRADFVVQFIVELARAIYWFNPLMWVASKQIALESERACDDLVLAGQTKASDYAEHLLAIAAGLKEIFVLSSTAVAMARSSRLEGRLLDILDGKRNRTTLTTARTALLGLLLTALIIPIAALRAGNGSAN